MSYERGTLVVPSLGEFLGKLPDLGPFPDIKKTSNSHDTFGRNWTKNCTPINLPRIEKNCSNDMRIDGIEIHSFLKNKWVFGHIFGHNIEGNSHGRCDLSEMDNFFRDIVLPEELIGNIKFLKK